jgi:protein-tyrosine-phosphatase
MTVTDIGPAGGYPDESDIPDVLVVCRANIARSPLMQARLQWEADRRLGAGVVRFASAGTRALFGQPAASGSKRIAARWGLDLDGHASRPIIYVPLSATPLNLVMSGRHVRALVTRDAEVASRTFTVPELVASLGRLEAAGGMPAFDPTGFRTRLEAVVALADAHRPTRRRDRRHLDVPDPISGGQRAFDALGERFETAAQVIADALFGPGPA